MLNSLQEITKGLLMLGCISFLVFLGMNRTVLSPLQKLNATAYELEQGNFAARVSDVGADEIGQLGSAINSMAASLEESIRKRDNLLGELGERSVELLGAKEEAEVLARERGEALVSLQASRELQRLIAQNVSDLIWAIDLSYRHTYANPAVERILGWTVEEYLSMSIENVLPPESLALAFSAIDEEKSWNELPNADQNRSKTLELEHYRKDGSKFMAEITASFLLNDDGTPAGIIGITRDITERRNLEQQVIQQQKLEGIGMLAGGVAHDINNLLTPIYFSLEMAERAIEPGHKALVRLQTIQKAATRIRDLVRQLLVFSRKQQAQVETLDLNEVVSTFIGILRRTMQENIDIEQQLYTGSCLIKADRTQLEQIIMNLAVNAQDAIDGVGRINIETGKYRLDEEYCKSYAGTVSGEYVILTFTDNGCGMDEDTRKKVFEPFFTTKPVGKGTGLGLSTVYGIVRQHGGHIDILSHPGKGSTFRVFLPVAKGSADIEVNPELAEIVVPSFTGTLLLVEDNDMLRESLHEALHGSGIKTMAASSPMEAIAIFKEHHNEISVLLTDMVMPEMNGPELYHSLTKLKEGLPVIFMSGYASDIDNYPEIVDNPDIFMTKPFMIQSLLTKLAKV
jgi:PAS domain S-box-containing protein